MNSVREDKEKGAQYVMIRLSTQRFFPPSARDDDQRGDSVSGTEGQQEWSTSLRTVALPFSLFAWTGERHCLKVCITERGLGLMESRSNTLSSGERTCLSFSLLGRERGILSRGLRVREITCVRIFCEY